MRVNFYAIAFLVVLLTGGGIANAQLVSTGGRFSVDYSQGCVPYEIKLTDLFAPGVDKSWFLLYEGETQEIEITTQVRATGTFMVTEPKKLTIIQWTQGYTPLEDRLVVSGYTPTAPLFSVYSCSSLGGFAAIQDPVYDYYEVRFGTNPQAYRADASTNFTATGQFLTAGDHPVSVRGFYENAPNNCGESSKSLVARPQLPKPQLNGLQWDKASNSVTLQYTLDPQVQYQLERLNPTTGTYERMNSLNGSSTDTTFVYPGLSSQYACFRIAALDNCQNNHIYSEPVCTAVWSVSALNGYNQAQYQTHPSFSGSVVLQRATGEVVGISTASNGDFRDEEIICRQQYCYQLLLQPQNQGSAPALSALQCVEAISTGALPQVKNIVSTWPSENELLIIPQFPVPVNELSLTLFNEEGKKVATARGETISLRVNPAAQCYSFTYTNLCAAQPSAPTRVCPLHLRNTAPEPDFFIPAWNKYVGYEEGVQAYILQELDEADEPIQEWNVGAATEFLDFGTFSEEDNGRRFRVMAIPIDNRIQPSYSNIYIFKLVMKGYFPNAFSPNGDQRNDEFKILGKFVEQASIWVYNRWGELLFYSADKEVGWDGFYKGVLLPTGTYVYKAEVVTRDGKMERLSGTIFLKR